MLSAGVAFAAAKGSPPPVPAKAADAIRLVATSAEKKDLAGLRALMVDNFIWSFGGDESAAQAIDQWKSDPKYLRELQRVLRKRCHVSDADHVECPGQGGVTFRAGFVRLETCWKMEFFVEGD